MSPLGLAIWVKPQGHLERQVKGWIERYHNSATHDFPEIAPLCAWFNQRIPRSNDVALIHNDYKYDNVVLDSNDITRIVGVLDWGMCTWGIPCRIWGLPWPTGPTDRIPRNGMKLVLVLLHFAEH